MKHRPITFRDLEEFPLDERDRVQRFQLERPDPMDARKIRRMRLEIAHTIDEKRPRGHGDHVEITGIIAIETGRHRSMNSAAYITESFLHDDNDLFWTAVRAGRDMRGEIEIGADTETGETFLGSARIDKERLSRKHMASRFIEYQNLEHYVAAQNSPTPVTGQNVWTIMLRADMKEDSPCNTRDFKPIPEPAQWLEDIDGIPA